MSKQDPALEPLYASIQGNILKGHGRDIVKLILLQVKNPAAVAPLLAEFSQQYVRSFKQQLDDIAQFKSSKARVESVFCNVFISASGYTKLGYDVAMFNELMEPSLAMDDFVNVRFAEGAKSKVTLEQLADPAVSSWEEPYQKNIDVMILLADDPDPPRDKTASQISTSLAAKPSSPATSLRLEDLLKEVRVTFSPCCEIATVEHGQALRNENMDSIEHFGYVDGHSQPLFFTEDITPQHATSAADLALILHADPFQAGCFGSFLVFRKLEQNVRGFHAKIEELAKSLQIDQPLMGAYVVGRFENGTPVVKAPSSKADPLDNSFDYSVDPDAVKCPFSAHIRKMNPRGDTVRKLVDPKQPVILNPDRVRYLEGTRRIVRRAIPYGIPSQDPTSLPDKGVGLLFMCFQAKISNQFGFLQKRWANRDRFVIQGVGIDGVIGPTQQPSSTPQHCPKKWGEAAQAEFQFSGYVTMKGGEFFFAPSVLFLRNLEYVATKKLINN